jgi:hypothetical protein
MRLVRLAGTMVFLCLACAPDGGRQATRPRDAATEAPPGPDAAPPDTHMGTELDARASDTPGGEAPSAADAASAPRDAARDAASDLAPPPEGGPPASSQGPIAEGTIVYSQDFEANIDGMSPSPGSLPASRYQRVDDPVGRRGKVLQLTWQSGDDFRTSANNKPRTNISNRGYQFPYGSKVSYAWGYMIASLDINATFAQTIRPGGPMLMLEGHNDGDLIVRCGGTTALPQRLLPNRWYDFRVEIDYRPNGYVQVYLDGQKVYERRDNLGFDGAKTGDAHWDGGIYNTELGISNNRTRTVYISNLSVGRK